MTGRKDDGADGKGEMKARWDLLPMDAVEEVVIILTQGAKKYSDENWKVVPGARRRYVAAALRHLTRWMCGERTDKESGRNHLGHAICCLIFLLWFDLHPGSEVAEVPDGH